MLANLAAQEATSQDEGGYDDDRYQRQEPVLGTQRQTDADTEEQIRELLGILYGGPEPHDGERTDQPQCQR